MQHQTRLQHNLSWPVGLFFAVNGTNSFLVPLNAPEAAVEMQELPWDWQWLEGLHTCCTNSSFIKNGLVCTFILKAYCMWLCGWAFGRQEHWQTLFSTVRSHSLLYKVLLAIYHIYMDVQMVIRVLELYFNMVKVNISLSQRLLVHAADVFMVCITVS